MKKLMDADVSAVERNAIVAILELNKEALCLLSSHNFFSFEWLNKEQGTYLLLLKSSFDDYKRERKMSNNRFYFDAFKGFGKPFWKVYEMEDGFEVGLELLLLDKETKEVVAKMVFPLAPKGGTAVMPVKRFGKARQTSRPEWRNPLA
jgi:hypothetical protein